MSLRHLRALVALSDLKLVARVSEALGVTQPSVSKQIAELEKIVGEPVVTRDRNRLYLTPIGTRLAEHGAWWRKRTNRRGHWAYFALSESWLSSSVPK
ncbi:helix-turn-helix domain-containing protein [Litoreibacter janthinus]|uniref:helix-turn-helix domain-containing protein n=1 Tax=Litoreibacter janthinus TaxID=670154 RepID=UPI001FEA7EDC|nr:LysR family transcriptional regulator [Litoreibacter janthinus]